MSSVTAVPLRPIKKGSMFRLWLALLVLVLVAAALIWAGLRPFGSRNVADKDGVFHRISYQILKEGTGPHPARDDFVQLSYKGTLKDGKVFDETPQPTPMDLGSMIPGFSEAVTLMKKGGRIRVTIPPELAYGSEAKGDVIPANSTLTFDMTLYDFKSRAEVMEMQRQQQMQQMLQQQMMQQQRGGQGGPPPQGVPSPGEAPALQP